MFVAAFAFAFGDVDSRMTPERTSRRPSSNEFLDPGRESPVMSLDEVRQAAGWIHDSAELETAVHRILYGKNLVYISEFCFRPYLL